MHAVTQDHDSIQGQPEFGAILGNEFVHRVLVGSTRREDALEVSENPMVSLMGRWLWRGSAS